MNKFDSFTKPLMWFMALLLVAFVAGCGGGSSTPPKPAPTTPGSGTGAGTGGHGPAPVVLGAMITGSGAVNVPNFAILAKRPSQLRVSPR